MFKTKKLGNQKHNKQGQFSSLDYKTAQRHRRLNTILLLELSLLTTLGIILADLTAQKISSALYPLPEMVKTAHSQGDLTIQEHICNATNGENCSVIYNLCTKESGTWLTSEAPCQQYSVNKNINGTYDYSWLQVNDVHIIGRPASKGKGTITMNCVYDLYCISRWANEQIKAGNGHIWVGWSKI